MGIDNAPPVRRWPWRCRSPSSLAGVLFAMRTNFDPATGPVRLIFAFEAVIIGGLGSLWGTLVGGMVLGIAQAIGAQIDPGWQIARRPHCLPDRAGAPARGSVPEGAG